MTSTEEPVLGRLLPIYGLTTWRRWRPISIMLLLGFTGTSCEKRQLDQQPPEHLVLVVFDTLRADRMSLYGHHKETTPFLEQVARESLVFQEVRAPAPWTVPSHASMFTGLPPALHRAQWGRISLAEEFQTLAETLEARGFCTVALSANGLVSRRTGLLQGFQTAEIVKSAAEDRSQEILSRLEQLLEDLLAQKCRLFIFLNFMDTHIPYNAGRYGERFGVSGPGPVREPRAKWEISAGERHLTEDEIQEHGAAYEAAVRYSDDVAKQLMDLLASGGILGTSLLVFTSDHGDGLGAHQELGHSLSLWEEQLEIPLVVRLPSGERGGEKVAERTTLTALMPSVLDWLRVPRPEILATALDLDAASASPIAADYRSYFSDSNRRMNRKMAARYPQLVERIVHAHALYCGDFKLIVQADGKVGYYDLLSDPEEQNDLISDPPVHLRDCLVTYRQIVDQGRLTDFDEVDIGTDQEDAADPLDLETLRALGYIQ